MLVTHVRTDEMCAVDMQNINVFMNRFYRKEIKDKHKIAIEKLERHSVFLTTTPFHIQCNLVNKRT